MPVPMSAPLPYLLLLQILPVHTVVGTRYQLRVPRTEPIDHAHTVRPARRSGRGRRQRDQSAEGGTRNEAGLTGRLCFGRPATTRRYDSVTRLSTSAGPTSAPARTVIQCFLFMW